MTAPINAYKVRQKFTDLTDDEAKKLIRLIRLSSEQNGILIMKSLANSIKKALSERRIKPRFKKPCYEWQKPTA